MLGLEIAADSMHIASVLVRTAASGTGSGNPSPIVNQLEQ